MESIESVLKSSLKLPVNAAVHLKAECAVDNSFYDPLNCFLQSIFQSASKSSHRKSIFVKPIHNSTNDPFVYMPLYPPLIGPRYAISLFPMIPNCPPMPSQIRSSAFQIIPPSTANVPLSSAPSQLPKKKEETNVDRLEKYAGPLESAAHRKRNVYKSIIRHMNILVHKSFKKLKKTLLNAEYTKEEINNCFIKIVQWNDSENHRGIPKRSQSKIENLVKGRTIYTYVLLEAVKTMMSKFNRGAKGRIKKYNLEVYRAVCEDYYSRANKLINKC